MNLENLNSSSLDEEYSIDAQGFILNCSSSPIKTIVSDRDQFEKENVMNTSDDDLLARREEPSVTLGYDLSPFLPCDDTTNFLGDKNNETCCLLTESESWPEERLQKQLEESLLQNGGTQEQLARIELYNTRVYDSDSEEDDVEKEDTEEGHGADPWKNEESDEDETCEHDNSCNYEGLDGDDDDDERDQEDRSYQIGAGQGQGQEHGESEIRYSKEVLSEASMQQHGTLEPLPHMEQPTVVYDTICMERSTEIGSGSSPFAAHVPLLRPPPKEKLDAYLLSKKD
jgi:hypothetical protein